MVSGSELGDPLDVFFATAHITGTAAYDYLGRNTSGVGDVNLDGLDDMMVGACYADKYASDGGAGYLFYGPVSGTIEADAADAAFFGEGEDWGVGQGLGRAGDLTGDGYTDLLIGAWTRDAGTWAGGAFVLPVE